MSIDPRDVALKLACPCESVPKYGRLQAMEQTGQRVLISRSSVLLEVKRSWLDAVVRIASLPAAPPLPFGEVQERIRFTFGVIPIPLLEEFIQAGRAALPNEIAGALVYSAATNKVRLVLHRANHASPVRVEYQMPDLAAGEEIAIDLHTHGRSDACWSGTDDLDDQGVKVCGVFGNLHRQTPTARFRLAVNGTFVPIANPWEPNEGTLEDEPHCPTLDSLGFERLEAQWNT